MARESAPPKGPGPINLARTSRPARWILATRIKTLSLSVIPVLTGTWFAAQSGSWQPGVAVAATIAATAIQIGTNLWNDAADAARGVDTPQRLGPPRMTALGLLPARQIRGAALAAFGLAAMLGLYLTALGGWPIVAIGLCSLAMGYLYSMGPRPLAGTPFGEALVVLFFGVVAVAGTTYLHGVPVTGDVLLLGVVIGLPAAAVLLVNNHRDRASDALAGRRTLAILLGVIATRWLYAALLLLSLAGAFGLGRPCPWGLAALLAPALLAGVLIRQMVSLPVSSRLNGLIARTALFQMLLLGALVVAGALCR